MAIECVRLPGGCLTLAPCVPPHPTGGPRGWMPPARLPRGPAYSACRPLALRRPALARSPARARRMGQGLVNWGGGVSLSVGRGRYSLRVFFAIAACAGASFVQLASIARSRAQDWASAVASMPLKAFWLGH